MSVIKQPTIDELRRLTEELRSRLPEVVDVWDPVPLTMVTLRLLRELLRHRVADLVESGIVLLDQGRVLPSIVLARAAIETSAMLSLIATQMKNRIAGKDVTKASLGALLGSKQQIRDDPFPPAIHIMNAIRESNKECPGILTLYEQLCEYAHPNAYGVMMSYRASSVHHDTQREFPLGRNSEWVALCVSSLGVAVHLCNHHYDSILSTEEEACRIPDPS